MLEGLKFEEGNLFRLYTRFHYYDRYVDIVGLLPETSTKTEEEAKSSIWELEGLELELSMAMDPESFAAKVLNPKKRKPDPETDGEGLPQHPTAKRNLMEPPRHRRVLYQQVHQHPRNHQQWTWRHHRNHIVCRHQESSLKFLMLDQRILQYRLEKVQMQSVKKSLTRSDS